jgi:hypothetical protein
MGDDAHRLTGKAVKEKRFEKEETAADPNKRTFEEGLTGQLILLVRITRTILALLIHFIRVGETYILNGDKES